MHYVTWLGSDRAEAGESGGGGESARRRESLSATLTFHDNIAFFQSLDLDRSQTWKPNPNFALARDWNEKRDERERERERFLCGTMRVNFGGTRFEDRFRCLRGAGRWDASIQLSEKEYDVVFPKSKKKNLYRKNTTKNVCCAVFVWTEVLELTVLRFDYLFVGLFTDLSLTLYKLWFSPKS